ncbi:MAG TPA: cytochrome c biogenesis protein CcsA, partial [Phycisphaerae bacterium]|nr:cytochrome c biogenesis protein CcsA [Phycisphaerae bacterium]
MSPTFGEFALSGAMLACAAVLFGVVIFLLTRNEGILRSIRAGVLLIAGLLGVSSWSLLTALLDDNFKLDYVLRHSEKTLALQYKIAAFWAGQEGSLLLWAFVLAGMTLVMALAGRRKNTAEHAVSLGVMTLVTGFFTAVMLFAGNPFDLAKQASANGEGLNPMLQNLAMVLHPPMLFLGYAGFTAPFALLMGALLTGSKDGQWLRAARPWMVYSWVVLTVGIVLGAWWAYVELSWGGYWAWDPVENASIFPWFTGTALLHSAVLQSKRGIFKRWVAGLTAASFFLCIFGTYLTRSSVVQSMHGFPESPISKYFLSALAVIAVWSIVVMVVRRDLLVAEHTLEDLFSREGFFLAANILLSVMTATLVVGTIFPVISGWFSKTPVTVGAAFYNNVILPVALLLALLMATGPVLGSGAGAGVRAARKLGFMGIAGLLASLAVLVMKFHSPWVLAAAFVIGAIAAGIVLDIGSTFAPRAGQNFLVSGAKALAARPRHWGAQVAHLGLAAIIAGVAGSSVYGNNQHLSLQRDVAQPIGSYSFTLKDFAKARRPNH